METVLVCPPKVLFFSNNETLYFFDKKKAALKPDIPDPITANLFFFHKFYLGKVR